MAGVAKKIAIVTDSVADIPNELVEKYDIRVVPLYVNVDGKSYRENFEIDQDKVYGALLSGSPLSTSTPAVNDFLEVYRDIKEKEDPSVIYSIHLSSALSGTMNAASSAADALKDMNIKLIDSRKAAISQGFIVLAAAAAAKKGAGEKEIDAVIRKTMESSYFYATFDNFEYIVKGGRAPFLAGFVKRIMILKPVITFSKTGSLGLNKFCMTKRSSLKELYNLIKADIIRSHMGSCLVGICYGNDEGPAEMLKKKIEDDPEIDARDFIITKITSVMAAHTGPGIWGVAVCPAFVSRL